MTAVIDLMPFAWTIGGGFFVGLLAGYAIKKAIKIISVIIGLFIAALAYMEYQRIIDLNWTKMQAIFQDGLTWLPNSLIHISMEPGIIAETKYANPREAEIKKSVFAISINSRKLSTPLHSRFFVVELESYMYEEFYEIALRLLDVRREIACLVADAVWNTSSNIRDCVRIGKLEYAGSERGLRAGGKQRGSKSVRHRYEVAQQQRLSIPQESPTQYFNEQ